MFYDMPGGCQAPTRSQENCTLEAPKSAHSDAAITEKHRQNSLESTQLPSEKENQCPALDAMHYSLSLRGRRLSPIKKALKIQGLRINSHHSRCLDLFHDKGREEFSALSFSYRKSPQKPSSQRKGADSRVAWMTLDGLLVNAVDTTSNEMGKFLGPQEIIAWNGFAPLQKVLVVAVTAAAASAAKQRHSKDMRRLQLAIATRDKDCEILREKITELQEHLSFWKEQAQNFCEHMEANGKEITDSFLLNLGLESTPKCDSMMLEQFATPQLQHATVRMPNHIACFRKNLRSANFRNDRDLGAHLPTVNPEDSNGKRTFLDRLSESRSVFEGQSTPQMPFTQLNKISTPSNNLSPKQVGRLSRYCQKGCRRIIVAEDSLTSCVPYTELVTFQQKEQLSEGQRMINDNCRNLDRKDERLESDQSLTISDSSPSKSSKGDETNVDSAFQAAVKHTVDNVLAPESGRHYDVNHTWSSDMVIEQLLGELENAAAKVASMEVEIKPLRDSEMSCERKKDDGETQLAESGFHTCKELEKTLELLKDTEKRLESCKEACKRKDKAISKLEDEVAALQEMVTQLRSLQATPKVVGQQDPSPVQTFLTSNLLFNLDSPTKFGSPVSAKSSFSSWRGLDELSKVSDSLERESREGSCDSEMYGLERVRAWQTDGSKEDSECRSSVLEVKRAKEDLECISSELEVERVTTNKKNAMTREIAEKHRKCQSSEEVRRSSSSTDEPLRKSTSSSSTDESGSNTVRHGRFPQLPKYNSSQARKLKFSSAADARLPDENGRKTPSPVETGGGLRRGGSLSSKASNVLAGVEPNTPMRERKPNGGGKDKFLSYHSLDGLNKAKENFAHRRRWM